MLIDTYYAKEIKHSKSRLSDPPTNDLSAGKAGRSPR